METGASASHPPNSWSDWYQEHSPKLFLFARQNSNSDEDAEDVLQDAILKLWRSGGSPPALPLVFTAVRHTAIDHARSRNRRLTREQRVVNDPTLTQHWFLPSTSAPDDHREVQAALATLPEKLREVVVLRIWGDLTFAQVAETLSIPPEMAASRYRTALQRIKRKLDAQSRSDGHLSPPSASWLIWRSVLPQSRSSPMKPDHHAPELSDEELALEERLLGLAPSPPRRTPLPLHSGTEPSDLPFSEDTPPRRTLPFPRALAATGIAALLVLTFQLGRPPRGTSSPVASSPGEAPPPSIHFEFEPVQQHGTFVDARPGAIIEVPGSSPIQPVHLRSVQTTVYRDTRDGSTVSVDVPKEELLFVPVSFH